MKKLIIGSILASLFLIWSMAGVSIAEDIQAPPEPNDITELKILDEPNMLGRLEDTGNHFEIKDSEFLNVTLDSTEPIKLIIESVPEMVTLHIESTSEATSTQITLDGFLPSTTYYKYEDDYHNLTTFTTDSMGKYTYIQDLSRPHLVFIQTRASTIFLTDAGWSDPTVGTWDAVTRTAILTSDINQTIQINTNNITLDGNGHTVTGSGRTGYGVFLSRKSGITIKDLSVKQFNCGIYLYSSSSNTLTDNTTSNNAYGIALGYSSSNNTLANNTANWNYTYGIYLYSSSGNNTLTNNTANSNKYYAINLYSSSGNTLTDNTTSNNVSGIRLYSSSDNNTLTGNTASNNQIGIYLYSSSGNTLTDNTTSNNIYGIYLGYSSINNTLAINTANWNYNYGIYLYYASNNKIYNNSFIDNTTQACVEGGGGNVFNLYKPIGGNHWNDWTTPDSDRDGFVDSPYIFSGGQDNLPLADQYGWLVVGPSTLSEEAFSESILTETLLSRKASLENVIFSGDFEGTLNFTSFDMVTIITGAFVGKGFSRGQFDTVLEGVLYKGNWQGVLFLKPQEKRIYLKGSVSGEITGIVEGYLTESVPDSGTYDQYQATWKIGSLDNTNISATVTLKGTLAYQDSAEYLSTGLYVLQTNVEGNVSGRYAGSLNTVLTHVRISDQNNPYFGEGFSIISYVSEFGSGEGWTYDRVIESGKVELKGMFTSPLLGIVSANLDETKTPRSLFLTIAGIDLGLPPAPDLKVKTWGPIRISPGQKLNYIIEYRNDGLKAAEEVMLFKVLDSSVKFLSASPGADYEEFYNEIAWSLGKILPKTIGHLSVQVEAKWGLPLGTILASSAYIFEFPNTETQSQSTEPYGSSPCTYPTGKIIYLNGIDCRPDSVGWKTSELFIREKSKHLGKFGVWVPIYYLGMALDVIDVEKAAFDIPTDNNGLTKSLITNACYDVCYAYSGGTRTAVTATWLHNLECEKLVLMSPIKGEPVPMDDYKYELQTILAFGDVKEIVIYQSERDNIPGGCKINPNDPWLSGKNIQIKSINNLGHTDWPLYVLKEQRNTPQQGSFSSSTIAVAHDPNIKYGPDGNVSAGQKLSYKVEYENEGEGIAFGVYFTDTLDEDLDDSTLAIGPVIDVNTGVQIAPPGTYNSATRTITWLVGEVGPGQGGYAEFSVNVKSDAPDGTEIINYATVYFPSVPETTRTNGIVSIVRLNQPPVTMCNDITVHANENCQGNASVNNGSYDPDGDNITITQSPAGPYSLGTANVTLTVTDDKGASDSCTAMVSVIDVTLPSINLSVSPNTLWPPNHKMVLITPMITANDNCGNPSVKLKSITMNEGDETNTYDPNYDPTTGDGHTIDDILVDENGNIYLRAERKGNSSGRIYTITYTATDASINRTNASAIVTVPHDQR